MSGEYYRIQKEKQMVEELKWLDMEAQYVQREYNRLSKKPRTVLPDQGQRDHNKVSKPNT